MRFLIVNAMMQYGQQLYDRGDFDEASAVFSHVLVYDSHQAQAIQYLREMGRLPELPEIPDASLLKMVDFSDAESLKKAIEAKRQSIEQLRAQIVQIRADIAAQSGQ